MPLHLHLYNFVIIFIILINYSTFYSVYSYYKSENAEDNLKIIESN